MPSLSLSESSPWRLKVSEGPLHQLMKAVELESFTVEFLLCF